MSNISHDYIENYIRELLPKRSGVIGKLEEYAAENGVPIIHKEVAQFLRVLIKSNNIKSILEVGAAIGYSAGIMADAAGKDSKIVTIERDDNMYKLALENIEAMNMKQNITIIKGEAREVLDTLTGSFDMVFLDAAKGHYDDFLPVCLKLLKVGGILVGDNVLFRGMVANDELVVRRKVTIVKRMRNYLTHISNMPELETVVLPFGDGIAFSTKLKEV